VISPCRDPGVESLEEEGGHMDIRIYAGSGKKVVADYEGFTIATDQSVKDGGDGSAPDPFSLFLISLGTCVGHYVYTFCAKRNIPVDGISVTQQVDRDKKTKMIKKVVLEIALPEGFPEKYTGGVVKAASLCTVKKHVNPSIEFEITTRTVPGRSGPTT
jgi:ribosomal protein S12 methylthiotransferase accessory factor